MENKVTLKEKIFNFFFKFRYGTVMFLTGIIICFWDAVLKFATDGKYAQFIKGFVSIKSSYNTGAAWSIMSDKTWLLILFSILFIVAIILANWFFSKKDYFYAISMGLVISGAIGNLIDRIRFGYVRDFISLDFINFPIFNLADCAITIGVILLCVYFIIILPKREKKEALKTQTPVLETAIEKEPQESGAIVENVENTSKESVLNENKPEENTEKIVVSEKPKTTRKTTSKKTSTSKGKKSTSNSKDGTKSSSSKKSTTKSKTTKSGSKSKSNSKKAGTKTKSSTTKTTKSKGVKND